MATDAKNIGAKVAIGIEEARGEVITFLEDDDVYVPERLQIVYNAFKSIKDLIHFHNDYAYIDEKGNFIGYREGYFRYKDLIIPNNVKRRIVDEYVNLTWASLFNSAVAIRRSISIKRLNIIRHLIHIDPWLLYISLIEPGNLMATSRILTFKGVNKLGRYHQTQGPGSIIINTYIQYLIDLSIIMERSFIDLGCRRCITDFLIRTVEISSFPKSHRLINIKIPHSILKIILSRNLSVRTDITVLIDFMLQYLPNFTKILYLYARYLLGSSAPKF